MRQQPPVLSAVNGGNRIHKRHACWMRYLASPKQVNRWEDIEASGSIPDARDEHVAVWNNAVNGFYVFGGFGNGHSNGLSW